MLYYLIAFLLALIPALIGGQGDGIRTPKEIASIFGLISIIALGLSKYKCARQDHRYLWLFLIWCFASTVMTNRVIPIITTPEGVVGMPSIMLAWKELFYTTLAIGAIVVISSVDNLVTPRTLSLNATTITFKTLTKAEQIRGILNIVSYVIAVTCIYSTIQILGSDDIFRAISSFGTAASTPTDKAIGESFRVVSCIGNPSLLGTWVAFLLPVLLYLKGRRNYLAFILACLVIYFTKSATAIVAGAMGVLFYSLFTYRKRFTIPALIIILCSGIYTYKHTNLHHFLNPTGRIEVHKEAWHFLQSHSLRGMGLGTFEYYIAKNPDVVSRLKNENWKELHDEYGQIWWSVGIIGLGLFLAFILNTFGKFFKARSRESIVLTSCLVSYLVMSSTLFTMRVAPHSVYACIFTGLLLHLIGGKNETQSI